MPPKQSITLPSLSNRAAGTRFLDMRSRLHDTLRGAWERRDDVLWDLLKPTCRGLWGLRYEIEGELNDQASYSQEPL